MVKASAALLSDINKVLIQIRHKEWWDITYFENVKLQRDSRVIRETRFKTPPSEQESYLKFLLKWC